MKKLFLCFWILAAPAAFAYHLTAGPKFMQLDSVNSHLNAGRRLAEQEFWNAAVQHFQQALAEVPEGEVQLLREVRLETAQAMMKSSKLPVAHAELKALLDEILKESSEGPEFENRVRESLASAQFYMTWLMRLEGATAEEWEPEIESARQNYSLLAERASACGASEAVLRQQENLDAAVKLARMELTDLQGMPLPCQCRGCCSGKCASRKEGKKPAQPQAKDARGASAGIPADGQGS